MPQTLLDIETQSAPTAGAASVAGVRDVTTVDPRTQRLAREELRRQIARLERQLGETFVSSFPRRGIEWTVGAVGGPRVLGLAELERVRDDLARRLREAQDEVARRGAAESRNRERLEALIAAPERHHWVRISNEDVGEPGCRHWHSRPRWGLLGMLMGWWRVKVSSGCPLHARVAPASEQSVSRKRRKRRPRSAPAPKAEPSPRPEPVRPRRAAPDDRPRAPWGSFPLVELVVLVGLVMVIVGFFVQGPRGVVMVGTGVTLSALAGLELSIREHFAGYRSHTLILSGFAAIVVLGALFFVGPASLPPAARLAIAAAVMAVAAWLLTRAFRRRSGVSFRIRAR